MTHYDDDELIMWVRDPSRVAHRAALEAHLDECAGCRLSAAEVRTVEEDLRDPAVWRIADEIRVRPPRLGEALALEAALQKEDATARRLLEPVLRSPMHFAEAKIAERPPFRTAGVARMLCSEANRQHDKRPKFSLQLADAACAIAAALADRRCQAVALRERANALRYLGRFADALQALDQAEALFDGSAGAAPFDQAIVGYIRGSVLVQMERASEALSIARSIIAVFQDYGEQRRELAALLLEGLCLDTLRLYTEALPVFQRVIKIARSLDERSMMAYGLQNAAITCMEIGELDQSDKYFVEALALYDELGIVTEKVRVEWAMGDLAMARGNLDEAERLLDVSRLTLQKLGLRNDHALATLEWVEVRLALNRLAGVPQACREILVQFDSEGMNQNARMALAHLHQALAAQHATPELVREIRLYLKELPRRPATSFSPAR